MTTARIIHSEEGYTLQDDCVYGDSFPARDTESEARQDYFNHLVFYDGAQGKRRKKIKSEVRALEVVEA